MRFWLVDVQGELPPVIPASWLQAEEIRDARFVPLDQAHEIMESWQHPVLVHVGEVG
jgi:hypothetical protein